VTIDLAPLLVSLKTALAATLISLVLGVLGGRWQMSRRGTVAHSLDVFLMLPIALPPTIIGLGLLLIFGRSSPVGEALAKVGMSIVFTWPAAVLAAVVMSLPIMYQSARGAFAQVDANLLDTARIFGFSELRILWQIMLPLAWPGIAAGVVLTFLRALGEFGATLMIAGNIPGRTQTAPLAIFFAVEAGERWAPILWALVVIAVAVSVLCLVRGLSRRFEH
jgi:molybdate transport system permease protein